MRQVRTIFHRIKGVITQAKAALAARADKCLWKEEFGFHSAAPASADQAGAGPGSEFEVFCSTEFGFAAPVGGLGGRENVKINIMQPQIKSPRFINTSSSVRKLGSAP